MSEFEVLESGIKLKSIQNGATKALQDIVDQTFTIGKLIGVIVTHICRSIEFVRRIVFRQRMQGGGVDFFPTEDAPNVIEGCCSKLWVMEKHLYQCMAHSCTAYNFTWSRSVFCLTYILSKQNTCTFS